MQQRPQKTILKLKWKRYSFFRTKNDAGLCVAFIYVRPICYNLLCFESHAWKILHLINFCYVLAGKLKTPKNPYWFFVSLFYWKRQMTQKNVVLYPSNKQQQKSLRRKLAHTVSSYYSSSQNIGLLLGVFRKMPPFK